MAVADPDGSDHCCGSEHCKCSEQGGRLVEPRLLLLLRERKACGYELLERIEEIPLGAVDTGAIYRFLRRMEREGLVKSEWDTGASGPAKRTYRLTRDGMERLAGWVVSLRKRGEAISQFIQSYESHERS
jgi:PadR family transcriptional regulator, regulatory protein PadR